MPEKITYGIKNAHYAEMTEDEDGFPTFGEIKKLSGATELSLPPTSNSTDVYSEGMRYFHFLENQGYDGNLNVYQIPDDFRTNHIGEYKDSNGVIAEKINVDSASFALLGEFQNDIGGKRFVLYNVVAGRAEFGGVTKTDTLETKIFSIPITCMPTISDGIVKATITKESNKEIYDSWFDSVYYNPVD